MKLATVQVGVIFVFATVSALPVSVDNVHNYMEVVDGPKEFLVPLAPFKTILKLHTENKDGDGLINSDLGYMVYGKYYLMKMLGIKDKRLELSDKNFLTLGTQSGTQEHLVANPSLQQRLADKRYQDGISFPPRDSQHPRRPYRFQPKIQSLDVSNSQLRNRIEERSAPFVSQTNTKSVDRASTTSLNAQFQVDKTANGNDADEEDVELLRAYSDRQNKIAAVEPANNEKISGSSASADVVSNSSKSKVEVGNRFLLDVPNKNCPEGQRKNHRGDCKPIYVHKPSLQDGIHAGKITGNLNGKKTENSASISQNAKSNLELTTVFRSFIEHEKKLKQSLQEAEAQLAEIMETVDKVGKPEDATFKQT